MNCFMLERTAILLYHFRRQQDDHINLGIHLQNSNGQTNVIEISLSSEGVVYAYPQGFVRKAHGNKFDECKGLQSVLFVRTLVCLLVDDSQGHGEPHHFHSVQLVLE